MENKKEILEKEVKSLKMAIAQEKNIKKELDSDKTLLGYLGTLTTVPDGTTWGSLDEWKDGIKAQIKRGENTLLNIELKKLYVEALEHFVKTL